MSPKMKTVVPWAVATQALAIVVGFAVNNAGLDPLWSGVAGGLTAGLSFLLCRPALDRVPEKRPSL